MAFLRSVGKLAIRTSKIDATLARELILLLGKSGYTPIDRSDAYEVGDDFDYTGDVVGGVVVLLPDHIDYKSFDREEFASYVIRNFLYQLQKSEIYSANYDFACEFFKLFESEDSTGAVSSRR